MLKYITLLIFCLTIKPISAQLQVSAANDYYAIAQAILGTGNGFVGNINFAGDTSNIGFFTTNNSNLGITSGVIICTGNRNFALGPNNMQHGSLPEAGSNLPGDAIMSSICGDDNFDVTIFEFSFIAFTDSMSFTYVFASEEYQDSLSFASDGFGIFVNGPGYSTNTNIALIPGTSDEISTHNINKFFNNQYYRGNGNGLTPNIDTLFQYNGYCSTLTAKIGFQINGIYHLQFAIADATDGLLDSGAFISAASFTNSLLETTKTKINLYPNPAKEIAVLNYANINKGVVQIIDALGRIVYTSTLNNQQGNLQIPTNAFAAGIYHVRVLGDNNNVWNGKLVVE